jgi:flagellar biosynthesis/type III secretory pathway protein FliH
MPSKEYYYRDPEKYRAETLAYTEANREKVRESKRRYHHANRERLNAGRKERYLKAREQAYSEGKTYGSEASRRFVLRQYGLTEEMFMQMCAAQNGVCYICGSANFNKNLAVDHGS